MEEIVKISNKDQSQESVFCAVFDPLTGEVTCVGPTIALKNVEHKIPLEDEIGEMIIDGKINIFNCAVDIRNMSFQLLEKKAVVKIDDVLHRIVNKKWTDIDNPDIFLSLSYSKKTLTIQLTEEFGGTFKLPKKYQPVIKRKILWHGDTILDFYVTAYNDPHILYSKHSIYLKDLVGKKIVLKDITASENCSVYTRRVLQNYLIEIK